MFKQLLTTMTSFSLSLLLVLLAFDISDAVLTGRHKSVLLSKHNKIRSAVSPTAANMKMMSWDNELAQVAQTYAERCTWQHNERRTSDLNDIRQSGGYYPVGENLYLSTSWDLDYVVNAGIKAFDDEKPFYNFWTNYCSKEPCGHYTQVVWADTDKVGCGIHLCPSVRLSPYAGHNTVLVCNYGRSGNWVGEKPYRAGSKCSQCPQGFSRCIAGLCLPDEPTTLQATTTPKPIELETPEAFASPDQEIIQVEKSPSDSSPGQEIILERFGSMANSNLQSLVSKMEQRLKALEQSRPAARPSAHLNGIKEGPSNPAVSPGGRLDALFWSQSAPGSHLEGGFRVENGQLMVPSTGLYFIYSQIWTAREGAVRHFIYSGRRRLMVAGVGDGLMHTSWLGGVHQLSKGDSLKVVLTNKSPNTEQSIWSAKGHSFFGAFRL